MLDRTPKSPPKIKPLPEGTKRPLWSVMIPSHNCFDYLRKTIESVLVQALPEELMQIEVIDDFSTDGDVEALVKEIGKGRVAFFKQERNVGSLRNFETCINRAMGERLHILHGDDLVRPGFYAEIDTLFTSFPNAGAAFTGCTDINEHDVRLWDSRKILDKLGLINNWLLRIAEGQLLQTPCIVVKRSVYENLGGFFGVHYGEDWEMWVRIAANYPVAYSPKKLAYYRVHSTNITSNSLRTGQNIKDIATVIDIIQDYLPVEHRERLRISARRNYSIYIAIMSDSIYHNGYHPKTALVQVREAFKLHSNRKTLYHLVKIFSKVLLRYKNKKTD